MIHPTQVAPKGPIGFFMEPRSAVTFKGAFIARTIISNGLSFDEQIERNAIVLELFKAPSLISLTLSGVFIALLLRQPRSQLHKAFALFLAALSMPLAYNYLRLNNWPQPALVEAFTHSILLAYGPILWSIVRISVKKPVLFPYWQALPFVGVAFYKLFFYQGQLSVILSVLFYAHIGVYAY